MNLNSRVEAGGQAYRSKNAFAKQLNRLWRSHDAIEDVNTGKVTKIPISFDDGCDKADWGNPPFDFGIICAKYKVNIRAYMPHLSETSNWYIAVDPVQAEVQDVKLVQSKGYPQIGDQPGLPGYPTIYCIFQGQNHYNLLIPKP